MTASARENSKTLEQHRASHAWAAVQAAKKGDNFEKFHGQAKKLPVRIIASGLGQALAFLKAKKYSPELLRELGDWVLDKRFNPNSQQPKPDDTALLKAVIERDAEFLRWATDEVLAYLQWLNRFADAEGSESDLTAD